MASTGFGGIGLVEVYVMRSLHKEKMKKMEREAAAAAAANGDKVVVGDDEKPPSGCFFWVSKKTHPAQVASAAYDESDS